MHMVNHFENIKKEQTLGDKSEHVKLDMNMEYPKGPVGRQVGIGNFSSGDKTRKFGTRERYSNSQI